MEKKNFDCVAMKNKGAEKVHEQIKNLSREEELLYWQKGTDKLKNIQAESKSKKDEITVKK